MKRYLGSASLFAGCGLVGPAIGWFFVWSGYQMNMFTYELLTQVWPFWLFAQYEPIVGQANAMALGAGWNAIVFAALGLLASSVSRSTVGLASLFVGVCVAQVIWFQYGMGGFPDRLSPYLALAAACLLLAVPFAILARVHE